jgi:hypothetical protein
VLSVNLIRFGWLQTKALSSASYVMCLLCHRHGNALANAPEIILEYFCTPSAKEYHYLPWGPQCVIHVFPLLNLLTWNEKPSIIGFLPMRTSYSHWLPAPVLLPLLFHRAEKRGILLLLWFRLRDETLYGLICQSSLLIWLHGR